jgi:uncharacterized protein YbjQ (UPF0145 family)
MNQILPGAGEVACIRAAGFEPLGQVMGATARTVAWAGTGVPCVERRQWRRWHHVETPGTSDRVGIRMDVFAEARRAVLDHLADECASMGGDGVVGVRVEAVPFKRAPRVLGLRAFGTAVRARGPVRPPRPFLCHLRGQDFLKLIDAGWVPADVVFGMAIAVQHENGFVMRAFLKFGRRREVAVMTWLAGLTRARARRMLARDAARCGADGLIVDDVAFTYDRQRCQADWRAHDIVIEATVTGTAIAAFGRTERRRRRRTPAFVDGLLRRFQPAPGRRPPHTVIHLSDGEE